MSNDEHLGKTALHAFEAASMGYLIYDHYNKKSLNQQRDAYAAFIRENYVEYILLRKILSIDFADDPTGIDAPMQGLVSAQVYRRINDAFAENIPLQITWESNLDDMIHTDRMWVTELDRISITTYRPRTPDELANFDRLRQEEAWNAYLKERREFHANEAAREARDPWYRRWFKN